MPAPSIPPANTSPGKCLLSVTRDTQLNNPARRTRHWIRDFRNTEHRITTRLSMYSIMNIAQYMPNDECPDGKDFLASLRMMWLMLAVQVRLSTNCPLVQLISTG